MTETLIEQTTETVVADNDEDFTDWFCVKTEPYPCPCRKFVAEFFTYAHIILVWPDLDDSHMLTMCSIGKIAGRDPKVVPYKTKYGKCISYYEAISNPHIHAHG